MGKCMSMYKNEKNHPLYVERTQAVCCKTRVRGPESPHGPELNPEQLNLKLPEADFKPPADELPSYASLAPSDPADYDFIARSLSRLLLCRTLDEPTLQRLAAAARVLPLRAGEVVVAEGRPSSMLVILQAGQFELLQRRQGMVVRVNSGEPGRAYGEIRLMYDCAATATVAATTDASVWVLERDLFRRLLRESAESQRAAAAELAGPALAALPLLSSLRPDEKLLLVDAFQEEAFAAGCCVIREGDVGDKFYIIKEGEAQVFQGEREVNRLFRSDFFGEQALLQDEPRRATVCALTPLVCLTLDRRTFVMVLGPLQDIMAKEKSPEAACAR